MMLTRLKPLFTPRCFVAMVDQLMDFVGQFETQVTASRATAEKLMAAVVAKFMMESGGWLHARGSKLPATQGSKVVAA